MRGYPVKTPETVAEAIRLREQGKTLAQVAEHFGVSVSAVDAWINDPDGKRSRARKRQFDGKCKDCGGPTRADSRNEVPERCAPCRKTYEHENAQWDRESIIAAARRWEELTGRPVVSTDWNFYMIRQAERRRLMEAFHRATGPWPHTMDVSRDFGGWNGLLAAVGAPPRRPHNGGEGVTHAARLAEARRLAASVGVAA